MALRDTYNSSGKQAAANSSSSALAELPAYWDCTERQHKAEWEIWWELFVLAVKVKHAISVPELLRIPTENNSRVPALLNNLNEQAAERKVVSKHPFPITRCSRQKKPDGQIPLLDCIHSI